jgi:hypothetical protein
MPPKGLSKRASYQYRHSLQFKALYATARNGKILNKDGHFRSNCSFVSRFPPYTQKKGNEGAFMTLRRGRIKRRSFVYFAYFAVKYSMLSKNWFG